MIDLEAIRARNEERKKGPKQGVYREALDVAEEHAEAVADIDALLAEVDRLSAWCSHPPEGWSCGDAICENGWHMVPDAFSMPCPNWPTRES